MTDAMRHHGGLAAEAGAATYYRGMGAEVLAERARTPAGEIDLVVRLDGTLVFVEVKRRRSHGGAAASVSARQRARIFAAAEIWMAEHGHSALTPCRFDVVTVDAQGTVEVIDNAFGAGDF
jgi:putative endonuclease